MPGNLGSGERRTTGALAKSNQFRSLYSYQTFKWLILQTQAHTITVDDIKNRIAAAEKKLSP